MRLYGVYMRLYGVCMAYYSVYMAVYSVGYAIMAYGIGLRDRCVARSWAWRVYTVLRRSLSVGYGVHVW